MDIERVSWLLKYADLLERTIGLSGRSLNIPRMDVVCNEIEKELGVKKEK